MRRSCLACRDSGGTKHSGTWTASATGVMALSECFFFFFFECLVAGDQKASLASLHPFRHLKGSLAWGPSLLGRSGT